MKKETSFLRCVIWSLLFLLLQPAIAQESPSFTVAGRISGFGVEDVKLLKKLKKNILLEGPLAGVKVVIRSGSHHYQVTTGIDGAFELSLSGGRLYSISIAKSGYSTVEYSLDVKSVSSGILTDLMVLLAKEDATTHRIGTFLMRGTRAQFMPSPSDEEQITIINEDFAHKTVQISNGKAAVKGNQPDDSTAENEVVQHVAEKEVKQENDLLMQLDEILEAGVWTEEELQRWEKVLDSSKALLPLYPEGSEEYSSLLKKIKAIENKLGYARTIIDLQEAEIKHQRKTIWMISLLCILVAAVAFLLYYFLRQQKKHLEVIQESNAVISLQNNRINSSLEYASVIQQALLNKAGSIAEHVGQSFVFYRPKVMVSGDFYWFSKKGDQLIMVVADCTGHGVPGALLTMLGHSALAHIVNGSGITQPKEVMAALDAEITRQLQDGNINKLNGMDAAIVRIKCSTGEGTYCGAMREIYHYTSGELRMLKPNIASIASGRLQTIQESAFTLQKGDTLFMFTDGYQDQFKGGTPEVETYNFKRFEQLLTRIGTQPTLNGVNELLLKELESWKKEHEQIDDILIAGIRL